MTRRSALLAGLAVLLLLVTGQAVRDWHPQPVTPVAASVSGGLPGKKPPPKPKPSATAAPRPTAAGARRKPPVARVTGVRRHTGSRSVALTFDDGPNPTWTPRVLDLLRAQHVHATFCLIGVEVRAHPDLVRRIVSDGHALCNHSWHHDLKMGQWPADQIRADLQRTSDEIHRAVPGARIRYFREPGGLWTPTSVAVVKSLGMIPLGWAVDPSDWDKPPAAVIANRVLAGTRAGSVVLMHDGGGDRSQTLTACQTLIPQLRSRFRLIGLP